MEEYRKALTDFCANYRGPKLCINTRNVGHSLSQIVHTRGGARVLHSLRINYDDDAFLKEVEHLQTYEHEPVCKEVAMMLSITSTLRYGAEYKHIGIVGKLSTSRYTEDDSMAYISVDEQIYLVRLNNLDVDDYMIANREQNLPLIEDYAISQTVISIITHGIESLPDLGNGFMRKIEK